MIVRYETDGSIVMITQNDHAQLSGLFAAHWGNTLFEKARPYESAVRAAMFHDRGWIAYETSPRLNKDTGKTPNYRDVPNDSQQLAAFEWAGEWLSRIDAYAGLLISKHRTGLWQSRYGVMRQPPPIQRGKLSDGVEAFISRSEARQREAAQGLDPVEVAKNYHLLQVWDLLSLYICSQERLKQDVIEPVPTGYSDPDGVRLAMTPVDATTIQLDPYPFDQPSLTASVVHRRLRKTTFRDENELRAAYFGTAPQIGSFTFVDASR
jgi:hypothetical protein